jgi:hypothetical protein
VRKNSYRAQRRKKQPAILARSPTTRRLGTSLLFLSERPRGRLARLGTVCFVCPESQPASEVAPTARTGATRGQPKRREISAVTLVLEDREHAKTPCR